MIIVIGTSASDPDFSLAYGPFDSEEAADGWITRRISGGGKFSYHVSILRTPNE